MMSARDHRLTVVPGHAQTSIADHGMRWVLPGLRPNGFGDALDRLIGNLLAHTMMDNDRNPLVLRRRLGLTGSGLILLGFDLRSFWGAQFGIHWRDDWSAPCPLHAAVPSAAIRWPIMAHRSIARPSVRLWRRCAGMNLYYARMGRHDRILLFSPTTRDLVSS